MNNNKPYLNSMYIEIDRESYESQGAVEIVGEPIEGSTLYHNMLEEDHGLSKYNALGSDGLGYDIVSPTELNRLLQLVSRRSGSIVGYFIRKRDSGNCLRATLKTISESTGVSIQTVHKTISDLRKAGFLKKGGSAEYMVSPDLVYRGKFSKAAYLRKVYEHFGKISGSTDGKEKEE